MNAFTFHSTTFAIKRLINFSKAKVRIHDKELIPKGSNIFVINHFTRIETVFLHYYLKGIVKVPVWSLADAGLFKGNLSNFLDKAGALATDNPDRDKLMVRSLLTGEYAWIIFPEGRMVKSKKIYEKGEFLISSEEGRHKPHTGAATLALRTEFYRERIRRLLETNPDEAKRLMDLFEIKNAKDILEHETKIIPVNLTYYPIAPKPNALLSIAESLVDELTERLVEELMTEGAMLLSGVDVDMHFGKPISVREWMNNALIDKDLSSPSQIDFDDAIPSKSILRESSTEITKDYMTKIYDMTTINHDHIFATLLKFIPVRKIQEYDFKCRAYLAADIALESEYYVHESLSENQINILTDDRFEKYENFMVHAEETGLIHREDGYLYRDYTKFSENFNFHRIRVDSPISVIANEAEPLRKFQSALLRLSLEPEFQIRRRMTGRLIEKLAKEYEKDYKTYYKMGDSKDLPVAKPFLLEGDQRKIGVLFVHGYMASPREIRDMAIYLSEQGYWVYAPRLKGHGTSPDDLAIRSHMEWVESVEEGYALLKSVCNHIVAAGFSTGAGLALDLVTRAKDIKAVVAISPPLKLHDFNTRFVPAVNTWNQFMKAIRMNVATKKFVENRPENPHINYFRNPIAAIRELDRLMTNLEQKFDQISIPALLMQARRDPVVDIRGTHKIFEGISSEIKEFILLDYDRHGILVRKGAERVYRIVADFIEAVSEGWEIY